MPTASLDTIEAFIARWRPSGGAERANYQLFLTELAELLEVPRPDPATPESATNAYVFERAVTFQHPDGSTSPGFIDLYKRGCFVLEAKQGTEKTITPAYAKKKALKQGTAKRHTGSWDAAMLQARGQAEQYIRALPADEGRPPFLIVVDVGHSIELYAEFSRSGGAYVHFPDTRNFRIKLDDLRLDAVRDRLRAAWTDPLSLDPAARAARVTREIASRLAELAKSLEANGHAPDDVATFLMRCLFTMFAEDVHLLPADSFRKLLQDCHADPSSFEHLVVDLWQAMKFGNYCVAIRQRLLRFNGHLFDAVTALPLNREQIDLLIDAASADWRDVEPAIFGTLVERALDPRERHKLGAHYTPRAYVERLVVPTLMQPLRDQWDAVKAAAVQQTESGDPDAAIADIRDFLQHLTNLRILDPACGSGNFLYVSLSLMKELEGEILDLLDRLGEKNRELHMHGFTVHPEQFHGIEINPRAAAIADLVLWIGYLQWHFRTHAEIDRPPEPIIKDVITIECRDALLACDAVEPLLDTDGQPVTRWDGHTTKPHPVTGEEVPDESARVQELRYLNPRQATWPAADYIVGNPPFIGTARMRDALGNGYTETLRRIHADVPESADFVMYWWNHAASLVRGANVTAMYAH